MYILCLWHNRKCLQKAWRWVELWALHKSGFRMQDVIIPQTSWVWQTLSMEEKLKNSHLQLAMLCCVTQISRSSLLGSSTTSLIRRKKNTASLPSISLWSYVSAMYIIGRGTTCPPTTMGRLTIECMPRIADCKFKQDNSVKRLGTFIWKLIVTKKWQSCGVCTDWYVAPKHMILYHLMKGICYLVNMLACKLNIPKATIYLGWIDDWST